MLLNVESTTLAKTGKSIRVKADGNWYGAKLNSGLKDFKGQIEAEVEDGDFGKWIGAYKKIEGQAHAAAAAADTPKGTNTSAPWWMPFVSNTVAHAIAAGKIQNPTDIGAWAKSAKETAEAL